MNITSLVLKVSSRCNLNCKYCYMYNLNDTSYTEQPALMSKEIVDAIIEKSYLHCIENNIKEFLFTFHGGEPLLQSWYFFRYFVCYCNSIFKNEIKTYFSIQTNGTLINEEIAKLFDELQITIGISIDGLKAINDQNRLYKNGKSAFDDVMKGIDTAFHFDYHKNTLGILSVINLDANPIDFYNLLKKRSVKNLDFLFPYNTYDNLPDNFILQSTVYADWLIKLFDLWFNDENRIDIRMFNGFIGCLFGDEFPDDLFGWLPNALLVIETNGNIEPIDYLKSCGNCFTKTKYNILSDNLSDTQNVKLIDLYYHSHRILCNRCDNCKVKEICGGGNLTARYSKQNGFNNPSLYCNDFLKLIIHIQNKVLGSLPEQVIIANNMEYLNYEEEKERLNLIEIRTVNILLSSFKEKINI